MGSLKNVWPKGMWLQNVQANRPSALFVACRISIVLAAMCLALVVRPGAMLKASDLPDPYNVEPGYDGYEVSSLYVPSADGTRLAVRVYRPTLDGEVVSEKLPVILRQIRGEDGNPGRMEDVAYFTERGYVWVSQSRRGTGASFGTKTAFVSRFDALDAKSVIEWAGEQPFSSGKVVAYGCSNEGFWHYRVMTLAPRHLVAVAPQCASAGIFDFGIVHNGINHMALSEQPYAGECPPVSPRTQDNEPQARPVDTDIDGSLLAAARIGQQCRAPFLGQFWLNMPRDGYNAFSGDRPGIDDAPLMDWQAVRDSGIPILEIGGWFDTGVAGQFETQRLWGGRTVMLPRTHGNRVIEDRYPGDDFDIRAEVLRWFDYHAKGIENGADQPGILYYTINAAEGERWAHAMGWREASLARETYYFAGDGLVRDAGEGDRAPIVYEQRDVAWFDGGYMGASRDWAGDMSATDAHSIVHTSVPLPAGGELTGTPVARLWISADQPDVNVFAVLEDVSPSGHAAYITDGRLRASWRKLSPAPWGGSQWNWHRGFAEDIQPLVPGEPTELVFDFFPTSYVLAAGHSLRVSIITATGKDFEQPPLNNGRAVTLTLYRDGDHASRLELPLLENVQ